MEEKIINIKNSKLRLVKYVSGGGYVHLPRKRKMRYQFLISDGERKYIDTSRKFNVKSDVSCWAIERTKEKWSDDEVYSKDDLKHILGFVSKVPLGHIGLIEDLIYALRDDELNDKFYTSYGFSRLGDLKIECERLYNDIDNWTPVNPKHQYQKLYSTRRYSIYNLMNDLVGSKISMDPELVGEYKKISDIAKGKYEIKNLSWLKVTGILGNATRANISFRISSKEKTAGMFNIIKDGTLNMERLAVQVDDEKLKRRLVRTKGIEFRMMYKNSYLLNLTKYPIISKRDINSNNDYLNSLTDKTVRLKAVEMCLSALRKKKSTQGTAKKSPSSSSTKREITAGYYESLMLCAKPFTISTVLSQKLYGTYSEEQLKEEKKRLTFEKRDVLFRLLLSKTFNPKTVTMSYDGINVRVTWRFVNKKIYA